MFDGILLIDKETGWTSHDVVAKVRNTLKKEAGQKVKVGHTGTLDPLASGLMVVVVGSYCKRAQEFSKLDKVYEVTMQLGYTSDTGDSEGNITPAMSVPPPTHTSLFAPQSAKSSQGRSSKKRKFPVEMGKMLNQEEIDTVLQEFIGEIMQTPPAYSAVKVNGQRAYKLAREGKEVKLEPRKVIIHSLHVRGLTSHKGEVRFWAHVSSGTYIRSLVEDIGKRIGVGAYMKALNRTKVGEFSLDNAIGVTEVSHSKLLTIY